MSDRRPRVISVDKESQSCVCRIHGVARLFTREHHGRTWFECVGCRNDASSAWRERNRESVSASMKRYRAKAVDEQRARRRKESQGFGDSPSNETWVPIPGWEECYEVSDLGRVRSLTRMVDDGRGRARQIIGRILRQGANPGGYPQVALSRDGRATTRLVHALVLQAFIGPCPDGMEACHNDGNQKNNTPQNLRWDTHLANNRDRFRHGTYHGKGRR